MFNQVPQSGPDEKFHDFSMTFPKLAKSTSMNLKILYLPGLLILLFYLGGVC